MSTKHWTTADVDRVIRRYDEILRNNDTRRAVAYDDTGESYAEVLDVAAELGYDKLNELSVSWSRALDIALASYRLGLRSLLDEEPSCYDY